MPTSLDRQIPSSLDRFLKYVRIETTSRPECDRVPSTDCQFDLARLLVEELDSLGLQEAKVDEHCLVTATLPSNVARNVPVIGWIAHLDTSPDVSGKNVRPRLLDYRGGTIVLPNGLVIPEDAALKSCIGHRLVTTDGTTLLGADDKAGIAAIMTALERLCTEGKPHGTIRIAFTPDEEVGNGTVHFDVARFGAYCAYTVDGSLPGELNFETFTAGVATIDVTGHEIHPGTAKGVMVNAARIASEIIARLPQDRAPETTEDREAFIHPYFLEASVGKATIRALLRGFDDDVLNGLQALVHEAVEHARKRFPGAEIHVVFKEQYRNMREVLEKHPVVTAKLEEAAGRSGVTPYWKPIRGGTDGSRLSEMGLPTPNVFSGGHHFHSPLEWLSVDHLEKTVDTLVNLAVLWTE
ncbi:MAG TPA: peptidase T [Planctomycetaceae bacterium]|nr:peptidase T [Planctomycetaceae bacterium]